MTVPFAWKDKDGIPGPAVALLLSNSLILGALVSWWRGQPSGRTYTLGGRIRGGMLAGILIGEATLVVMKGGAVEEFIGWMRGWPHFGQWDEVLGFAIAVGILGAILGSIGATCSAVLRHQPR